jgi:hypothetical protein
MADKRISLNLNDQIRSLGELKNMISSLSETITTAGRAVSQSLGSMGSAAGTANSQGLSFTTPQGASTFQSMSGASNPLQAHIQAELSRSAHQAEMENRAKLDANTRGAVEMMERQRSENFLHIDRNAVRNKFGPEAHRSALAYMRSSSGVTSLDPGGATSVDVLNAAMRRLEEGATPSQLGLEMKSLNRAHLSGIKNLSKDSSIQMAVRMAGLPEEDLQRTISLENEKRTARQAIKEAHSSSPLFFSESDRASQSVKASLLKDPSLGLSFGDIKRTMQTDTAQMAATATSTAQRLAKSASGADQEAARALSQIASELREFREKSLEADKRLAEVRASGKGPGDVAYDKAVQDLRRSTEKLNNTIERNNEIQKNFGGGGGDGDGGSFKSNLKEMINGLKGAIAGMAPLAAAGFNIHQGMLRTNEGAVRKSLAVDSEISQLLMSRRLGAGDMTNIENVLKYRGPISLATGEGQFIGAKGEANARMESLREFSQNLRISENDSLWGKITGAAKLAGAAASAVGATYSSVAPPVSAILASSAAGLTASGISDISGSLNSRSEMLRQGGSVGGIAGWLNFGLTDKQQALMAAENKMLATKMAGRDILGTANELQDLEVQSRQMELVGGRDYLDVVQAQGRGKRLLGALSHNAWNEVLVGKEISEKQDQMRQIGQSTRSAQAYNKNIMKEQTSATTAYFRKKYGNEFVDGMNLGGIMAGIKAGETTGMSMEEAAAAQSSTSSARGAFQFTNAWTTPENFAKAGITAAQFNTPAGQEKFLKHVIKSEYAPQSHSVVSASGGSLSRGDAIDLIHRLGLPEAKKAAQIMSAGGTYTAADNEVIIQGGALAAGMASRSIVRQSVDLRAERMRAVQARDAGSLTSIDPVTGRKWSVLGEDAFIPNELIDKFDAANKQLNNLTRGAKTDSKMKQDAASATAINRAMAGIDPLSGEYKSSAAAERGMSLAAYTDKMNLFHAAAGPGYKMTGLGGVNRMIDMEFAGFGSFDQNVSRLVQLNAIRGGNNNFQSLQNMYANANSLGWESALDRQRFTDSSMQFAMSNSLVNTNRASEYLAGATQFMSTTGRGDLRSMSMAMGAAANVAAETSQTGGLTGAAKFVGAMGVGARFGGGLGQMMGLSSQQVGEHLETLSSAKSLDDITDINLQNIVRLSEGSTDAEKIAKAKEKLSSVSKGQSSVSKAMYQFVTGKSASDEIKAISAETDTKKKREMISNFTARWAEVGSTMRGQTAQSGMLMGYDMLRQAGIKTFTPNMQAYNNLADSGRDVAVNVNRAKSQESISASLKATSVSDPEALFNQLGDSGFITSDKGRKITRDVYEAHTKRLASDAKYKGSAEARDVQAALDRPHIQNVTESQMDFKKTLQMSADEIKNNLTGSSQNFKSALTDLVTAIDNATTKLGGKLSHRGEAPAPRNGKTN